MNENIVKAVSDIFTGKGSGLKLAMVGLVILGIIDAVSDRNYELEASKADGSKISLKPHQNVAEDESNGDTVNESKEPSPKRNSQEQTT
jgi:hypothetical protein